jgi:HlyD family secretion protein
MIDERQDVLAIPVDALRNVREVANVAKSLGLDPDSVNAQVRSQTEAMMLAMRAAADSVGQAGMAPASNEGQQASSGSGSGANGGGRGERMRGSGRGDGSRRGRWSEAGSATGRGQWRGRRGAGRDSAGASGGAAGAGASMAGGSGGSGGGGRGRMGRGGRAQVVVVKTGKTYAPRVVRIGISNYDYAQVVQGVQEGEAVVMLSVIDLQQQRDESMQRIRQRVGTGIPGSQGGGGGGGRGAGGGGGGGAGRGGS